MEKRNTIQKQLVLEAVHTMGNHPTADDVYARIAAQHPTVSKATVYRNLGSLSQEGRLRHIAMPGGPDRFDHCLTEHYHITCVQCGAFADAPARGVQATDENVAETTGYTQVTHDVVFYGICPRCTEARSGGSDKIQTKGKEL